VSTVAGSPPSPFAGFPGVAGQGAPRPDPAEACPLCGSPLHPEQEWCLRCGAAARTRLAATPNWRVPIAALVAVVAISLGVLTAALVDLAGSSNSTTVQVRTVTTVAPAVAPAPTGASVTPTTAAPAPSTTAPVATNNGATAAPPASARTGTGTLIPGATTPGTGVRPLRGK
jgi:hypothetical protein